MERRAWTRDELLVAFNFYCRTPFGRLHQGNPDITTLALKLGRTPSALIMKLCNMAALDPVHQERGVSGLKNASRADRAIWDEFHADWTTLAIESELALGRLGLPVDLKDVALPDGPTEMTRVTKTRLVQGFFRRSVLAAYEGRCSMCDIALPQLLCASHIIPWKISAERRADPSNGLLLCALHDRAFDRGLLAVDDGFRVLLAKVVRTASPPPLQQVGLLDLEGHALRLPHRFRPDPVAITYHRETVFDSR